MLFNNSCCCCVDFCADDTDDDFCADFLVADCNNNRWDGNGVLLLLDSLVPNVRCFLTGVRCYRSIYIYVYYRGRVDNNNMMRI